MNRRSSLFRKYAVYFVVLVTTALVGSGLIGLYFTYQENKAAALNLQSEKAAAAAVRIEAYVNEIVHQLGWMHLPLIETSLALIILENKDAEALFFYKNGVKSVFEPRRKASACLTIARHSV